MYILTKRTAPSDKGNVMHSVHGSVDSVMAARAWYRASRITDVIEIHCGPADYPDWEGNSESNVIFDHRLRSWREQEYDHEKQLAAIKNAPAVLLPGNGEKS